MVKKSHPLVSQADLLMDMADAKLMAARGGFDPSIDWKYQSKEYTGTSYYDKNYGSVRIPLHFGADIEAGYETANGAYLDPEITQGTVSYAGLQIPLLKGLLFDQRRAALKQAKIGKTQNEQERRLALNDVVFDASISYWQWAESAQQVEIILEYYELASRRQQLVNTLFRNGDRSAADTLEVYVQLQQLELMLNEARMKNYNYSVLLASHLWSDTMVDSLLGNTFRPVQPTAKDLVAWQSRLLTGQALETNPLLRLYQTKIEALDVEKRYKSQALWPTLNLKTRLLSNDVFRYSGLDRFYFQQNYNIGIEFKMPLFFREGRGMLEYTKLKIRQTTLDRDFKSRYLGNKISAGANEVVMTAAQLEVIKSAYQNTEKLYRYEVVRFEQGESSIFMVNGRENKVLETKLKELELTYKLIKSCLKQLHLKGEMADI
ncbi:MAG: TolC family protein [Saprospiraceae bacterium]|nr:TolC family protein [Saprospiraceae bacterium]